MNAQRHNKSPSFTKKIILLFILLIPLWSMAQTGKNFYLEAHNKEDLIPIHKTKEREYIELEFADPELNSIFKTFQIIKYEEAFYGFACKDSGLDKVFVIELDSSVDIGRLTTSSLIKKVEPVLEYELASGELPNDYYIPTFDEANQHESPGDSIRNDYLDLIQASCAWKLTKGDPNVIVGISDTYFSEAHEELDGKFEIILETGALNQDYT